ncbi:hypothetical protein [Nevskia ramosa]|uniref:hypothetical protein n=1 Tax=Nevskia ramosa TaxID=64002 RepID=UPI003D0D282B
MSDSFSVVPLNSETRQWLATQGLASLPSHDGRSATLEELVSALATLPEVSISSVNESCFPDGELSTKTGLHTELIINERNNDEGLCEFHFRGGHPELIERIVFALSKHVGPLFIYAHSGSYTKVMHAS